MLGQLIPRSTPADYLRPPVLVFMRQCKRSVSVSWETSSAERYMVEKITRRREAASLTETRRDIEDRRTPRQWHTPTMTRIDLKETLFSRGSAVDGATGSTGG